MNHFEDIKVNDTVYMLSIRGCALYRNNAGEAFREMQVTSVIRYPTTVYLSLSDGITTIVPKRANGSYVSERDDDEVDLGIDVYALNKKDCASTALAEINKRRASLRMIEKRCKEADADLDITSMELLELDTRDEKDKISEEEFASMALG